MGIIPIQLLKNLTEKGFISSSIPLTEKQFQPASLDLRIGSKAYRIRSSFLPQKGSIEDRLKDLFDEILPRMGKESLRQDPVEFGQNFEALEAMRRSAPNSSGGES